MAEPRFRPSGRMRPERPPEHPWLIRGIVILAAAVVVAGVIWAVALGHMFS